MVYPIVSRSSPRQTQAAIVRVLPDLSDIGSIPPMNALEILRETIRILRSDPSTFMSILVLLIFPVSAAMLSNFLISQPVVGAVGRSMLLLAISCGLPPARFLKQTCQHLAGTIVSSAICFPFLITFLLLARACIAYSVASNYASKKVVPTEFMGMVRRIKGRLLCTYIWVCAAILGCLTIFIVLVFAVCSSFSFLGYPPEITIYPALLTVIGFSVAYAHTIIVCNLANVISVLEDASGFRALLRAVCLVRGRHSRAADVSWDGNWVGFCRRSV
ncbi:hypothetical protein HPP92_023699 [Vanilla planifolia]|uniref:Uncharacterized protein n=1 Tax=Vanilla planifolia TaxID=51239 RepID=A0A835UEE2_VANPL|nr:hypothetical protein HPP92_023699 [Vanilla planifolia]